MNILLQKLLMRGRVYMAPADDDTGTGGSGGNDDLDLDEDEDLDEDRQPEQQPAAAEVKVGDQEDGSFVIEVEDEGDENGKPASEGESGKKKAGEEGQDDEAALEEKRAARRQERQDRKTRQREREEETKRQLAAERTARQQLEQRLADLEGRSHAAEIASVDNQLRRTESAYEQAKAAHAEAIASQDGEAAAEALETMQVARERYRQLTTAKQAYEQAQKQPKGAVDPNVTNYANKFMSDHPWYKHGGSDMDSGIVSAIDRALHAEGNLQPSQPEYWDELRARIKKHLPHRIAGGKVSTNSGEQEQSANKRQAPPRQNKTVVGGGGGESKGAGKGTFTLSPERVKAIKDAGMWDDPKARGEMITYYRNFDKQNPKG